MSTSIVWCSFAIALLQRLCLRGDLVDTADHVERLLRQVIVLAREDAAEAADRLFEWHDLAVLAGEHLRNVERLREEALDLARAEHGQLVVLRQLVHAQDRDDVLQLLVALENS